MYSISKAKFQNALRAFEVRRHKKWPNDLSILLDGKTRDWFVIEKPNAEKLTEIENLFQKDKILNIEDKGKTGNATKDQYFTQFGGCYIILGNNARYLSNNIRE